MPGASFPLFLVQLAQITKHNDIKIKKYAYFIKHSKFLIEILNIHGQYGFMYSFFLSLFLFFGPCCLHGNIPTNIEKYLQADFLTHPSGLQEIDTIYVINLSHRVDKWIKTAYQFSHYWISPVRFNAVNGSFLNEVDLQNLCTPDNQNLKKGQVGCILSHLSCLKNGLDQNANIIWICEDDILILKNPHILPYYLKELQNYDPEWDVLYTDANTRNYQGKIIPSVDFDINPEIDNQEEIKKRQKSHVSNKLSLINQRFGNYSYIVSKKGMKKILRYYSQYYLYAAYDIDIHYIPEIREYCTNQEIVTIDWRSTISDTQN